VLYAALGKGATGATRFYQLCDWPLEQQKFSTAVFPAGPGITPFCRKGLLKIAKLLITFNHLLAPQSGRKRGM
jgi:hypothetical protein